jgi:hypothetical protein
VKHGEVKWFRDAPGWQTLRRYVRGLWLKVGVLSSPIPGEWRLHLYYNPDTGRKWRSAKEAKEWLRKAGSK